jgi:hypothetical protein
MYIVFVDWGQLRRRVESFRRRSMVDGSESSEVEQ